MRIGAILLVQRKMRQAAEYFKKQYELNPQAINSGLWVSNVYLHSRNWQEAQKWAVKYITTHPEHGFAYTRRAQILLWGFGDLEKGGLVIEEGIPFAREHPFIEPWLNKLKYEYLLCLRDYQRVADFLESDVKINGKFVWKGISYRLTGDNIKAKVNFDSARVHYKKRVKTIPTSAAYHSYLGLAYAGLGHKQQAIKEGKKALELNPIRSELFEGERYLLHLGYSYIMTGENEQALETLETLLSIPSQLTVWRLKLDPRFDPLRNHPRFKQLIKK